MRKLDRFALQEGLVSALWQSWCRFCRTLLINSATGAVDSASQVVTSPHAGRDELEIAYIARALAQRQNIGAIRPLGGSHLEPTWGDPAKVNLIAGGLQTSNRNNLLTGFGVAVRLLDLQTCRNASAHLNGDRIADVRAARVRYTGSRFAHPSDMMFWIDPGTQDYLWRSWLDEMDAVSRIATA